MVAEDRYKRSHCQDHSVNSMSYTDFQVILTVQYLVEFPFSSTTKNRLAQAFARTLALAHHEDIRASPVPAAV